MGRGKATHGPGAAPRGGRSPLPLWERTTEDERLEFLAQALAYEAAVLRVHVAGYSRVAKGLSGQAAGSVDRLRRAALGEAEPVYLYGAVQGAAAQALTQVITDDADATPVTELSDRENAMRLALAHEAAELERMLEFASFPKSRIPFAHEQVSRMRKVAAGHYELAYASTNSRSFEGAMRDLRADTAPDAAP